jgi:hypothetical protein
MHSLSAIGRDHICDEGIIDSITVLRNGTIVLFREKDLYFFDINNKQLIGPVLVNEVFKEMKGPIDSALTILSHNTVTDFIGSSLYFENGFYYSFKNLGAYQVEWGNIVYLPHKGSQATIGSTDSIAKKTMNRKMSAAYFDPIDRLSRFIFSDGTVLGFTFELGTEYDKPVVSTLSAELKKYGVDKGPTSIDAAFTLIHDNTQEFFLFSESNFCSFKFLKASTEQKCDMKSTKDSFLDCKDVKRMTKSGGNFAQSGSGAQNIDKISGLNPNHSLVKKDLDLSPSRKERVMNEPNGDSKLSPKTRNSGHSDLISTYNIILFTLNSLLLFKYFSSL